LFLQHLLPAPQSTRALAKLILSHSLICKSAVVYFFGFLRIVLQKSKNDFPMRRILLHQFEFVDFGSRQQTFQHHHVVVQFSQRRFELFFGVNAILVTVH
jgi:hypothetical protein